MQPPQSRKWPGSKLQPFPIQCLESDFGTALPPAKPVATTLLAERHKFKCRYQGCGQMFRDAIPYSRMSERTSMRKIIILEKARE